MSDTHNYLHYRCLKGLSKLNLDSKQEYIDRLEYELGVIEKAGFSGYFLIVADFINWAKSNGIYVGPGRGSGASSLACYTLNITELDPLVWRLPFERFLNPERIAPPDLDCDFEDLKRGQVIDYLISKYGADRVAHIGTFGMYRAKGAVRAVARALGYDYEMGDSLAKLLLPPIHGKSQPLKDSIQLVNKLNLYCAGNTPEGRVLTEALKIEDHISSIGVHASGILISANSLMNTVPLFLGKSDEVTTQWEMKNIEEYGLIKFDILGLDALTKIHNCIDLIKEIHGVDINISTIPLDDERVFNNLRAGDTIGLFQLEASAGIRDLLIQTKPQNVEDISAVVALFRPGPIGCGSTKAYIEVKSGQEQPSYLIPELEPILNTTGGVLVYQEQAMAIARQLCGYTGGESDSLRKAIGKKLAKLMAEHEKKFLSGWAKNGYSQAKGEILWKQIVGFADYAFNLGHSAAYSIVTYRTAWLKAYYPAEFMCACMISDAGNMDQMIKLLAECRRLGVKVLPPDINESGKSFHVTESGAIRFGLGPIKNLGEGSTAVLEEKRNRGRFTSLQDFCNRVDLSVVNRLKLESLIKSGAFDSLGGNRASMLQSVEEIWTYKQETKKYLSKSETYEKKIEAYGLREKAVKEGIEKKSLKKPEAPVKPVFPELPRIDEMPKSDLLKSEHELLGFYVSSHPLSGINPRQYGLNFCSIDRLAELGDKNTVSLIVVASSVQEIMTKRKEKMAFLGLEDLTGTVEATIFPGTWKKCSEYFTEIKPLKIEAVTELIETDDNKIVKLSIRSVVPLGIEAVEKVEEIDAVIPLEKAETFCSLLTEYSGDIHPVKITFVSKDGTRFRCREVKSICNKRDAFIDRIRSFNG